MRNPAPAITIALVSLHSLCASAAPSIQRAFQLPSSYEQIYEDQENAKGAPVVLYYSPQRVAVARDLDRAVWSYTYLPEGRTGMSFSLVLLPSRTLEKTRQEVAAHFARKYEVAADSVYLKPLPVLESKVDFDADPERYESHEIPDEGILLPAELQFHFILTRKGDQWFRDSIIGKTGRFATFKGKVSFYDEVNLTNRDLKISVPLGLREVPLCALALENPCLNGWKGIEP
jgi:hypothetical protein